MAADGTAAPTSDGSSINRGAVVNVLAASAPHSDLVVKLPLRTSICSATQVRSFSVSIPMRCCVARLPTLRRMLPGDNRAVDEAIGLFVGLEATLVGVGQPNHGVVHRKWWCLFQFVSPAWD